MKPIIFAVLAIAVLGVDLLPQNQNARTGPFDLVEEMCKKNGVEEKFDDMKNATTEYTECLNKYIETDKARLIFQEAMENNVFLAGNFTEYCTKIPQLKACRSKFLESILPCTDEATRIYFTVTANSVSQILEYICYEGGERISRKNSNSLSATGCDRRTLILCPQLVANKELEFITEGGLQCFKNFSTMTCVETYGTVMGKSIQTLTLSVPEICPVLNGLQDCMRPQLAACKTTTASNLFDALVKILKDNFSCKASNKI